MLQLNILFLDQTIKALKEMSRPFQPHKQNFTTDEFGTCTVLILSKQTNVVIAAYIDGFLIVGEQVVESIEVPFSLSERQLQLVYLIVLLLDGSKFLVQRLLWEKQKNVRIKLWSLWFRRLHRMKSIPPEPSPSLSAFAAAWKPYYRSPRGFCFVQSLWPCLCTPDGSWKKKNKVANVFMWIYLMEYFANDNMKILRTCVI